MSAAKKWFAWWHELFRAGENAPVTDEKVCLSEDELNYIIEEELKPFRHLLWVNHGCRMSALFSDGGEMHCRQCMIDFGRQSAEEIKKRWMFMANERTNTPA